jgi:hypothetical protein
MATRRLATTDAAVVVEFGAVLVEAVAIPD